ncbi:tetratricopeptide repeat protein [Geomobilimonas luticola]|uniref:Tetratricopeptide repeat protein n=1 Tax=Geomobilimonas luticola TaxID=1114878 RepID=A0ABS5SA98_9BACT|nr:hypothetical protein [Geomobilimonas luticola]MBT0652303.1 hypothetical protein [Geomobilimonas luticola]
MHAKTAENSASRVALVAGLICLLVYLRALGCGFVNWDDQDYILNNIAIRTLDANLVSWAFTNHAVGWWMPLTWLSFALDYHFWGLNPLGYHLTNIVLHAVNTGLVVLIAARVANYAVPESVSDCPRWLFAGALLLAGLLFGIHPLRVESVAWATERKDVLNGLFFFGAVLAYLRYVRKRDTGGAGAGRDYLLAVVLFCCSLMAKQVSVVLPVMLLVLDWYPLDRLRRMGLRAVLLEKVPFLALSVAMTVFTITIAMQDNALALGLSFGQRLVISGNAVFEYVRLLLYPVGIIPVYIIPQPIPGAYTAKTIIAVLVCVGVAAGWKRAWLPAIWLCFLLPLVPVLAFTQNGIQAFAARFTYLPSVAPSIATALALIVFLPKLAGAVGRWGQFFVVSLLVMVLVLYGLTTQRLISVWHDSGTFWTRVIEYQPFDRAYFYRGLFHVDEGAYDAAVSDYTASLTLALKDGFPEAFNIYAFRGEALVKAGHYADAVADFTTAIDRSPHPLYFHHRGLALQAQGRMAEAAADFLRAGQARGQMRWFPQ